MTLLIVVVFSLPGLLVASPQTNEDVEQVAATDGRPVGLETTVSFLVGLDGQKNPLISFRGMETSLDSVDENQIAELLQKEFDAKADLDGVIIRAVRGVKYSQVGSLHQKIKSYLQENQIDKPVFIALQDPPKAVQAAPATQEDGVVVREFVLKNVKVDGVYERVARVARLVKMDVRLDPSRNSITIKGDSSKMVGIQNLINALDVRSTDEEPIGPPDTPPKVQPPKSEVEMPRNNQAVGEVNPEGKNRINPSNIQTGKFDPKPKRPGTATQGVAGGPVGRFQITVAGNNALLLDTVTGQGWFLDGNETTPMFWSPIPMVDEK